jgi:hypothetical protein
MITEHFHRRTEQLKRRIAEASILKEQFKSSD